MLTTRIIPCLDVEDGRVVKGIQFKNIRDAGDPTLLAKHYNEQGADEITFLDIGASYQSRDIMIDVVKQVSLEVFIPLTVGGGIRSIQDIREILNAGADKVAICTAAVKNPMLIRDAALKFGSQCIVLSVDAKRCGKSWHAFINGGRDDTGIDAIEWANEGEQLGVGEILLNSIDMDGTRKGYDIQLTKKVSQMLTIPVIASGGAGNLHQIHDAITQGKADAVLLASLLHYGEYSISDIKKYLKEKGVNIRW
jgi:cyclase